MKKILFGFGFFFPLIGVSATTLFPSSGIDFANSFVSITGPSTVTCMGIPLRENTAQNFSFTIVGIPTGGNGNNPSRVAVERDPDRIGGPVVPVENDRKFLIFGDWNDEAKRCFQKAGNYSLSVTMVDYAGNATTTETRRFTVKSATPSQDTSSFRVNCGDKAPVANAEDACAVTLDLFDTFENRITQPMNDLTLGKVSDPFTDDANFDGYTSFYEGLRISKFNLSSSDPSFDVRAIAPSIAKVETGIIAPDGDPVSLSTVLLRETPFQIKNLQEIDLNGMVKPGTSINFDALFASLEFDVPVALVPNLKQLNAAGDERDTIRLTDALDILGTPSLPQNTNLIFAENKVDSSIKSVSDHLFVDSVALSEYESDPDAEGAELPAAEPLAESHAFTSIQDGAGETYTATQRNVFYSGESEYNDPQKISLTTTAEYSFTGFSEWPVKYIAGGMGKPLENGAINVGNTAIANIVGFNKDTDFTNIGISVEGLVIGEHIAADDAATAILVTDYQPVDIREQIVKNAYQLVRNASNVITLSDEGTEPAPYVLDEVDSTTKAWTVFSDQDVVIIDFSQVKDDEKATLELTFDDTDGMLPSGKKTLIVVNGNVLITQDLKYKKADDSFGLILLRDKAGPEPTRGNIFVQEDVQKLSGTFFADGSFFGTSKSIDDNLLAEVNMGDRNKQLLLTGALLTKNTIDGARRLSGGSFYSPWGAATFGLAKKYDLNEIRQYDSGTDGGGDTCSLCVRDSTGKRDPNHSSFVLRLDQKAIILSPPGFEIE